MTEAWKAANGDEGSEGWYRIIKNAGPRLTWEYLMVDEDASYSPLFPEELLSELGARWIGTQALLSGASAKTRSAETTSGRAGSDSSSGE